MPFTQSVDDFLSDESTGRTIQYTIVSFVDSHHVTNRITSFIFFLHKNYRASILPLDSLNVIVSSCWSGKKKTRVEAKNALLIVLVLGIDWYISINSDHLALSIEIASEDRVLR